MTTEHETPLIRAVDDDEDQLISLEALLSGEGWDVAAYTSARDFFVNDRPSRPGCLILDLRMPDVSGLEVQAEMKKKGNHAPDHLSHRARGYRHRSFRDPGGC